MAAPVKRFVGPKQISRQANAQTDEGFAGFDADDLKLAKEEIDLNMSVNILSDTLAENDDMGQCQQVTADIESGVSDLQGNCIAFVDDVNLEAGMWNGVVNVRRDLFLQDKSPSSRSHPSVSSYNSDGEQAKLYIKKEEELNEINSVVNADQNGRPKKKRRIEANNDPDASGNEIDPEPTSLTLQKKVVKLMKQPKILILSCPTYSFDKNAGSVSDGPNSSHSINKPGEPNRGTLLISGRPEPSTSIVNNEDAQASSIPDFIHLENGDKSDQEQNYYALSDHENEITINSRDLEREIIEPNESQLSTTEINNLHASDLMRMLYEKMCRMEKEMQYLKRHSDEMRQLLLNRAEVPHQPDGMPNMPFRTLEDAERAEELAQSTLAGKEFIVKKLSFAGRGQSDNECAKKVMAQLFSNHTGTFFNWKGKNNKIGFSSWALRDAVNIAVRTLRPNMDTSKVENGIKEWLKSRKFVQNNNNAQ